MKTPILSRLLLGCALAAMVALGIAAIRVALPTPEAEAVVPEPTAAPQASVWKSEPAPVDPAPVVAAPRAAATSPPVRSTAPARTPSAVSAPAVEHDGACPDDEARSCTPGERASKSEVTSRPTVSRDAEFTVSPRGGSSRSTRGGDRHVSSGPMRMLGGAESTW